MDTGVTRAPRWGVIFQQTLGSKSLERFSERCRGHRTALAQDSRLQLLAGQELSGDDGRTQLTVDPFGPGQRLLLVLHRGTSHLAEHTHAVLVGAGAVPGWLGSTGRGDRLSAWTGCSGAPSGRSMGRLKSSVNAARGGSLNSQKLYFSTRPCPR